MGVATGLHERRHAPTLLPVACALEPARGSRAFRGNGLGLEAALDNAGVRLDTATVDEAGESHLALEGLVDHFSNFALGAIAAPTLLEPCGPFGEHWPCTGQHLGVAPEADHGAASRMRRAAPPNPAPLAEISARRRSCAPARPRCARVRRKLRDRTHLPARPLSPTTLQPFKSTCSVTSDEHSR